MDEHSAYATEPHTIKEAKCRPEAWIREQLACSLEEICNSTTSLETTVCCAWLCQIGTFMYGGEMKNYLGICGEVCMLCKEPAE